MQILDAAKDLKIGAKILSQVFIERTSTKECTHHPTPHSKKAEMI
jgi:hypothetical protein